MIQVLKLYCSDFINQQIYPINEDLENDFNINAIAEVKHQIIPIKKDKDSFFPVMVFYMKLLNLQITLIKYINDPISRFHGLVTTTNLFAFNIDKNYFTEMVIKSLLNDDSNLAIKHNEELNCINQNVSGIGFMKDLSIYNFIIGILSSKKIKNNNLGVMFGIKSKNLSFFITLIKQSDGLFISYLITVFNSCVFKITNANLQSKNLMKEFNNSIGLVLHSLKLFEDIIFLKMINIFIFLNLSFVRLTLVIGEFCICVEFKNNQFIILLKMSVNVDFKKNFIPEKTIQYY